MCGGGGDGGVVVCVLHTHTHTHMILCVCVRARVRAAERCTKRQGKASSSQAFDAADKDPKYSSNIESKEWSKG